MSLPLAAQKTIEQLLTAYGAANVNCRMLRTKIFRAAKACERNGQRPKRLYAIDHPLAVKDPVNCHIRGITFFETVAEAIKSPLYRNAVLLDKKGTNHANLATELHRWRCPNTSHSVTSYNLRDPRLRQFQ